MKIALVLSGSSAIGKGLGTEIDSHDLVIRMMDCEWQDNHPEDYGSKYDYGILPGPWSIENTTKRIVKQPTQGWLLYYLEYQKRKRVFPAKIYDKIVLEALSRISKSHFTEKVVPTRGLAALELIFKFFPVTKLRVYFGDSLRSGEPTKYPNGESNSKNPRHRYDLEKRVIEELWGDYVEHRI